jgi:hypothetical protein
VGFFDGDNCSEGVVVSDGLGFSDCGDDCSAAGDHINCANSWNWQDVCRCDLCDVMRCFGNKNILIANTYG